jgi:O-antigen/teichoic acid export membrane protein
MQERCWAPSNVDAPEIVCLKSYWKITGSVLRAGSLAWQIRPLVNAITENVRGLWKRALRFVSREDLLALSDQTVVSGTGFLTTLLIARWSEPGQVGMYAFGMSLLGVVLTCQYSLILQPYLIQWHNPHGSPTERAGASLTLSVLFSAGSILVLTVLAIGFLEWGAGPKMVVMTWAIAGVMPFALTREFARQFSFAHLAFGSAILLDIAVASIQLSTLAWLGMSGRMSALSAYAALGGAYAFATAGWLYCVHAELVVSVRHVRTVLKQTWGLGKWLFAGQIIAQVETNIAYWLSMAIGGAVVTGVYAACMSIIAFVNPLMHGLGNSMMPRSVLAWRTGGGPELRHEAVRNAVLITAVMTAFSLAVLVAGEHVMHFLYHGTEYEGHGHTLTILALAMFSRAVGVPASNALASMECRRGIVTVGAIGAAVTVILVWILMTQWGLLGAAYGLLAGGGAGTVARWAAFFLLVQGRRLDTVDAHGGSQRDMCAAQNGYEFKRTM